MTVHWIDPLKVAYLGLHAGSDWRAPEYLRQNFGSAEHYRLLSNEVEALPKGRAPVIIDFIPFSRLPNLNTFHALERFKDTSRLIFLCSTESVRDDICALDEQLATRIALVQPGDRGPISINSPPRLVSVARQVNALVNEEAVALSLLRRASSEGWLQPQVQEHTIPGGSAEWAEGACRIGKRNYLRMANQMLVTHFINMKALLSDVRRIDDIAYEVAWHSCGGFLPDAHKYWPDLLVAANDHAFLIGAAAQRLCGVPCAVIDRIGILPGRHLTRDTISQDVIDKRVVLISELSATASEIERGVSLLVQRGAKVALIVCCVWLECAFPRFVESLPFIGLCRPKPDLRFVYRSAE